MFVIFDTLECLYVGFTSISNQLNVNCLKFMIEELLKIAEISVIYIEIN